MSTSNHTWFDTQWDPMLGFCPSQYDLTKPLVIHVPQDPWAPGSVCAPMAVMNLARVFYFHTVIVFTNYPYVMRDWVSECVRLYNLADEKEKRVQISPKEFMVRDMPFSNLCIGITCWNQETAAARMFALQCTCAALKAVDYDCMGPVDFQNLAHPRGTFDAIKAKAFQWLLIRGNDVGKCNVNWMESALKQASACKDALGNALSENHAIPSFVLRLGGDVWAGDKKLKLKDKFGRDPDEWPECLKVSQRIGQLWQPPVPERHVAGAPAYDMCEYCGAPVLRTALSQYRNHAACEHCRKRFEHPTQIKRSFAAAEIRAAAQTEIIPGPHDRAVQTRCGACGKCRKVFELFISDAGRILCAKCYLKVPGIAAHEWKTYDDFLRNRSTRHPRT